MPIPNYLRDIAYLEKNKNNFTTFNLKCICECTLFDVYESYLDKKEAVKIKCSECGKEYTIYDSRYNGYSGMFCTECSEEKKNYIPHFKLKKRRDNSPVEICIEVEHDENLEAFKANTGIDCTFDEYTDAYTWITIYSIDNNSKKRKLFEFETD